MANGTGGAVFSIAKFKRMERQALAAIADAGFRFVADDGRELLMPQAMAVDSVLAVLGGLPTLVPPVGRLFLAQLDLLDVPSDAEAILILDARGDLAPAESNNY